MSPDKRPNQRNKMGGKPARKGPARRLPGLDDPYDIAYFKRHPDDDPKEAAPGRDFLNSCPLPVRRHMRAVLIAVAASPPHKFSGGGYWEPMHGAMKGWYEVRKDGEGRRHYRLFCRLDGEAENGSNPLLVIVAGMSKPFKTEFSDADYKQVRKLGQEYLSRNPRSLA